MSAQQGHDFRAHYLHEDNGFNSSPSDSTNKIFGANMTIDTAEGANQASNVFNPGSREVKDIIEGLFDGSWAVSFVYTNPWWLEFFFGAPSTSGSGPYDHSYDGEGVLSHQITIGRENDSSERVLSGCVASSATISPSVNGMVQVNIQGAYAEENVNTNVTLDSQPTIDYEPMHFGEATLDLAGSTLGLVQQGQLNINSPVELIPELGSRIAVDFAERTITPVVDFQKINDAGATDNLEKMYGGNTTIQSNIDNTESMTLTLDNGQSGNDTNKIDFNLSGTFPESYGEDGLGDPEADVTEQINRMVQTMDATATNGDSSAK